MKKVFFLVLIMCAFMSCELVDKLDRDNFNDFGSIIVFEVKNSSSNTINALEIYLTSDSTISQATDNLEEDILESFRFDMKKAIRMDGSYSIKYVIEGTKYSYDFGYYSNGQPLDEKIALEITNSGVVLQ